MMVGSLSLSHSSAPKFIARLHLQFIRLHDEGASRAEPGIEVDTCLVIALPQYKTGCYRFSDSAICSTYFVLLMLLLGAAVGTD